MNFPPFENRFPHLLLLPLYFITHKFFVLCRPFDIEELTSLSSWLINFSVSFFFALIPVCVVFLLIRKIFNVGSAKAAVLSTIIVAIFFLESELEVFAFFSSPFLRKRYLLLLTIILLVALGIRILKSEKFTRHVITYVNLLLTALIIYNSFVIVSLIPKVKLSAYEVKTTDFKASCEECPDIYYFILDAYTSNESLKKYWGFDNSSFTNELKEVGFFVADSKTKFTQTYYSMASTFNMTDDSTGINDLHRYEAMRLVKNNLVVRKMEEAGYDIHNLSFFNIGKREAHYGFSNFDEGVSKSLFQRFLNNTAFKSVMNMMSEINSYDQHMATLTKVTQLAAEKSERPRFIYVHLLAPHQPYVIDSSSARVSYFKIQKSNSQSGYLNQLIGLNKLMLGTVHEILNKYPENNKPVMIIQGDHGFRYLPGIPEEGRTILNAYYLPNGESNLYPRISPYNTFRVVFNTYFSARLNLLEDAQ